MKEKISSVKDSSKKFITRNSNRPIVRLRVVDFTIWNGIKFGFGPMAGFLAFDGAARLLEFLLQIMMIGFSAVFGGGSPGV